MTPHARIAALLRELADAFETPGPEHRKYLRLASLHDELADAHRELVGASLPPPIDAPSTPGVYCALGPSGAVKIGKAKNIAARLKDGQCWCADIIGLLAVLSDDPGKEGEMHRRFKRLWIRGEWFRLGPELIEFIIARRGA